MSLACPWCVLTSSSALNELPELSPWPPHRQCLAPPALQFGWLWSVSCLCRRWRPVCVLSCLCHDTLAHRYQAPNTHCIALQAPARLANKPTHELPEISTAIQVRKHCLSNCMCNLFCVSADGAVDAVAASNTNQSSNEAPIWLFGYLCNLFCVSADRAVGAAMQRGQATRTNQVRKHCLSNCVCNRFCASAGGQLVHWGRVALAPTNQVRKHRLFGYLCNLFCASSDLDGAVDAMAASSTNQPSKRAFIWLFGYLCNLFCVLADGVVDAVSASSTNQPSKRAFIWLFGFLCNLFCGLADGAVDAVAQLRRATPINQVMKHPFGCLVICVTSFVSR